jgi:hypothetical protein
MLMQPNGGTWCLLLNESFGERRAEPDIIALRLDGTHDRKTPHKTLSIID